MDRAALRQALAEFLGEERFRKFVVHLRRAGRLRYWQEVVWDQFTAEHPDFRIDPAGLRAALCVCELHGRELLPDTVEVIDGNVDYADWYVRARARLFPNSASGPLSSEGAPVTSPTAEVCYCPECRAAESTWREREATEGERMDERGWLSCADPKKLLDYLATFGKVSHRKQLLFACCCCRRIWPCLADERSRHAVETVERFADGRATEEDLAAACSAALDAYRDMGVPLDESCAAAMSQGVPWVVPMDPLNICTAAGTAYEVAQVRWRLDEDAATADGPALSAAYVLFYLSKVPIDITDEQAMGAALAPERAAQAGILRDVVGNPFRPLSLDPAWRTPTVLGLAEASYENRLLPSGHLDPERLAVLADSLEENGCTDAEILGHLRSPGPHVRGCAIVDLILDKR